MKKLKENWGGKVVDLRWIPGKQKFITLTSGDIWPSELFKGLEQRERAR